MSKRNSMGSIPAFWKQEKPLQQVNYEKLAKRGRSNSILSGRKFVNQSYSQVNEENVDFDVNQSRMNASDMMEHSRIALEKSHAQDKFYRVNPPKKMGKRTNSISSLQNT
jgi:hypothetical protein